MNIEQEGYCGQIVRTHDRDRYLLALGARKGGGSALFPLFAFNYEIAKTREVVSEPTLGLIRLQWWRDALSAFYSGGSVPKHEILDALIPVIEQSEVPQTWFNELLEAREADLDDKQPETLTALQSYAERTVFPLNKIALKIAGQHESEEVIRQISRGYGLVGLLRSVPWHAAQGRVYLPADSMEAHNLSLQDLSKKDKPSQLEHTIGSVLVAAENALKERPQSRYLQLSRRLALFYVKRLRRYGGNLYDSRIHTPPAGFLLRLLLEDLLRPDKKC